MSFRRPKGGRRVVEDYVRKISVTYTNTYANVPEILRFALNDKSKKQDNYGNFLETSSLRPL